MAASAVRSHTPRVGSAKWGRPRPMPVMHPMATRSLELDLTIRGTPTPGLDPEPSSRILQWPQDHTMRPKNNGPGMNTMKTRVPPATVWWTDNQLFEQVKERLATGYAGVKQMFKARDPYGDFIVTREGLFQILKSLVGNMSREKFDSFLMTMNLHWRSSISFDEFMTRFTDNPAIALQKLSDTKRHARNQKQGQQLEENLLSEDMLEWCPFTSAPHAFIKFRKKLHRGEVNIRDLLPAACFLTDGRVIAPQLREALALVNIRLNDTEFDHIWLKFDMDSNGTVLIKSFYKTLDLTLNGLPKPEPRSVNSAQQSRRGMATEMQQKRYKTELVTTTTRQNTSMSNVDTVEICGNKADIVGVPRRTAFIAHTVTKPTGNKMTTTREDVEETTTTTTTKSKKTTTTEMKEEKLVGDAKLSAHVRSLIQAKKTPPQFNNIMDHLHYKFEETYRNLQSAFKLFDFMNDGHVTRIDFRRILREFGFEIAATDLDMFLHRAGINVIQGLINYNQFLHRFQLHKENSVSSRVIAQNNGTGMLQQHKRIETAETLRAEDTEADVANFFHSDYTKLLHKLKEQDVNSTGVVQEQELRNTVNAVLRINMSDQQFEELVQRLSLKSANGTPQIDYSSFLDLFNIEPGHWNRQRDGLFTSHKYQLSGILPATPVLRLTEKAKTWMAPPPERNADAHKRVAEIRKELSKLLSDRFHVFDKNFQDMDRRRSRYMTKWQFGALIKLCGITVSVRDLEFLWASLDTAADNTLGYVTLVKTFGQRKQQQHGTQQREKAGQAQRLTSSLERPKTAPVLMVIEQPQVAAGSAKEGRLTELLNKVKEDVLSRWDVIYSIFLTLDRDGYASVSVQDMREILYKMKFPLTTPERDELCNLFDLHDNGWFHYLSFLHTVRKWAPSRSANCCVYDIHTKRLHRKAGPTSMAVTIYDFLAELKGILLKKFKTLRGSFKFFDLNHNGFIEEEELRKSLTSLGYQLSQQDFLDIFELLDRSQGQCIGFDDFKSTLLTL